MHSNQILASVIAPRYGFFRSCQLYISIFTLSSIFIRQFLSVEWGKLHLTQEELRILINAKLSSRKMQ